MPESHRQMPEPLFRTPVSLPERTLHVDASTRCLFIGSCFAEEVGKRAKDAGVMVVCNPRGTLYNMESLRLALSDWAEDSPTKEDDVFEGSDGLWHSMKHSSCCDAESREACLTLCREADTQGARALKEANIIAVTAGTNRIYRHTATGKVVANCHKQPAREFSEEDQTTAQIVESWTPLLEGLTKNKRVVFTVSPYRYAKYGFHSNQLCKATLLLAIEELCKRFEGCVYFPAYELVLDELRDYRFYAQDMLHVSPAAADFVWEKFREWTFTKNMAALSQEWTNIRQRQNHRPIRPQSKAHLEFEEQTNKLINLFERKWGRLYNEDNLSHQC